MSHELFLAMHEEALAEVAEDLSLSEWYRRGERVLDGACPLDLSSEGGYCAPILSRSSETLAGLLADNELPCGCLPNHQHGLMCTAELAPIVELVPPAVPRREAA